MKDAFKGLCIGVFCVVVGVFLGTLCAPGCSALSPTQETVMTLPAATDSVVTTTPTNQTGVVNTNVTMNQLLTVGSTIGACALIGALGFWMSRLRRIDAAENADLVRAARGNGNGTKHEVCKYDPHHDYQKGPPIPGIVRGPSIGPTAQRPSVGPGFTPRAPGSTSIP